MIWIVIPLRYVTQLEMQELITKSIGALIKYNTYINK